MSPFISLNRVLVERANEWLEENDEYDLINCESLDKKVIYVADVYSQSLIYADEDANTHAVHIIGLRYALKIGKPFNAAVNY